LEEVDEAYSDASVLLDADVLLFIVSVSLVLLKVSEDVSFVVELVLFGNGSNMSSLIAGIIINETLAETVKVI